MELAVGQTVYIYWNRNRTGRSGLSPVQIEKIGRKWVALSNRYRFDRTNADLELDGDGYSPPGRVYLSQEAYEIETAIQAAWWNIRRQIDRCYRAPEGVTAEAIQQATALLGLEPVKGDPE